MADNKLLEKIATFQKEIKHLLPTTSGQTVQLAKPTSITALRDDKGPDVSPMTTCQTSKTSTSIARTKISSVSTSQRVDLTDTVQTTISQQLLADGDPPGFSGSGGPGGEGHGFGSGSQLDPELAKKSKREKNVLRLRAQCQAASRRGALGPDISSDEDEHSLVLHTREEDYNFADKSG